MGPRHPSNKYICYDGAVKLTVTHENTGKTELRMTR